MSFQRNDIIVIDDSDDDDWNVVLSNSKKRERQTTKTSPSVLTTHTTTANPNHYLVDKNNNNDKPRILLLVGIPGSGKSTFAQYLVSLNKSRYVRVNQDELKTRGKCEAVTRTALSQCLSPIIDRCNFDSKQRRNFIQIAQEFNVPVDCIVFDVSISVCLERCLNRKHHPTIDGTNAHAVVRNMANLLQKPDLYHFKKEGIERMKVMTHVSLMETIARNYCFHCQL